MIYRTVSDEGNNMHFEEIASNILNAYNGVYQIAPFSSGGSQISVTADYEVSRRLTDLRGWQVIGRKIGFTNKSSWPLLLGGVRLTGLKWFAIMMNTHFIGKLWKSTPAKCLISSSNPVPTQKLGHI
jgi:hypothetical protein